MSCKILLKQPKNPLLPSQERILRDLGENLRMARLRRDLPTAQVSERAGVARATLVRMEKGVGGISLASLLKFLFALGLEADLQSVSRDDPMGRRLQDLGLLERKRASRKERCWPADAGSPCRRSEESVSDGRDIRS